MDDEPDGFPSAGLRGEGAHRLVEVHLDGNDGRVPHFGVARAADRPKYALRITGAHEETEDRAAGVARGIGDGDVLERALILKGPRLVRSVELTE